MNLEFTKMQGAGNDFIVINAMEQDVRALTSADWQHLASRHFGIGADQILLVDAATQKGVDFKYTIYNQDGGLVENCGNGARCFVKYVHDKGLTDKNTVTVEIVTGDIMTLTLNEDGTVTVNMGEPVLNAQDVPAVVAGLPTQTQGDDTVYGVEFEGQLHWHSLVSMGNPHAVQIVDDLQTAPVLSEGAFLESHPIFPRKANIGFMQIHQSQHMSIRVFERGVGETLACGTGACAAVVAGIRRGVLTSPVRVSANGGDLTIAWDGVGDVMMSGPAVSVFEGSVDLPLSLSGR